MRTPAPVRHSTGSIEEAGAYHSNGLSLILSFRTSENPSRRSSQNAVWQKFAMLFMDDFRHCEVALLGDRHRSATHESVAWATGCFETHVSARTPPQSKSIPALKTSVCAPSSRTPRKKVLYVSVLLGSPET